VTSSTSITIRVTKVRSQDPHGFGGAIFTGIPIDAAGVVLDACAYVVVKACRSAIGATRVERGQWWIVDGPVAERRTVVQGFELIEQQVEAELAQLTLPSGEHIVNFLAENPAFEHVGPVKARRLWERYRERLYDLLDAGDALAIGSVLTGDVAQRLVDAWAKQGQSRTLQWLQSQSFDPGIGRKVLAFFGEEAQARIQEDPYRLLSFSGKWADVDRLASEKFGVNPTDQRRLRGAVEEACYRVFADGHTAMLSSDVIARVVPLLGRPPADMRWRDLLATALSEGLSNGSFVQTHYGLQPLGALVMERQVAAAIKIRLGGTSQALATPAEIEEVIAGVQQDEGFELNAEQCNALHLVAEHAFACITGGAGVGKTTVLKSLYRLYEKAGVRVLQVALAGRAAKRMQEATNHPALTIASFLKGLNPRTFEGPTVLVIDEASMVDIISMSRICEALPAHVRLVLVGDPHQLMPVGPGLVLHCVQNIPSIPVAELKTVKRYGGEIARVASAIRAGQWPGISADEAAAVAFVPCDELLLAEKVVELYALDPENSQILSPLRNGPAGTKSLNHLCQARFTHEQPPVTCWNVELETPELSGLNLDDAVLCTRNLWEKGLQNGSLGRVVEVAPTATAPPEEESVQELAWVEWDDSIRRPITSDMLDDVELGYAITVHKAQGSQWPRVIIPVSASKLLDRTLLYTAVTRAQVQVILVGDAKTARRAVQAPPKAQGRNVALDLALQRGGWPGSDISG
jgi:exodeoxyribonuclease V alpha subunit